jgi:flagellar biosynthetic protein FliR
MLKELLSTDIFKFMLIFARLSAAFLVLPGFSSTIIFTRARLILALAITLLLLPLLKENLPLAPAQPMGLVLLFIREITIGLFMGVIANILLTPIDMAGSTIGYAIGLTNVFSYDPISEQQSQLLVGFLSMLGLTAIFVSDSHHIMIRAVIDSYSLFKPGESLILGDFSDHLVRSLGEASVMGFRLSAPLLVFSLTFQVGMALTNRLVPSIPVYIVGLPVQILGGLAVLAISLPILIFWAIDFFNEGLRPFMLGE